MTEDLHKTLAEKFDDGAAGEPVYNKPRLYVRELSGFTYSLAQELKKLRSVPRVITVLTHEIIFKSCGI